MATRKGSSSRSRSNRGSKISQKRIASNAIGTQRTINRDYKTLAQDYGRLFQQLWRIPATKYVLGGAAVATLVPMAMRYFRRHPEINEFIRENMDVVEEKFDEVSEKVSDKISSLKGGSRDDLTDARH